MISAIQATQSVYAAGNSPALGSIPQLVQRAISLLIVPSAIVSLGTTSPVPVTYNEEGLFESQLPAAHAVPVATADTTAAAGVAGNTVVLQALPSNSQAQSIDSLLSTNLGLSAATLLGSTGAAATTTTAGSDGTWVTTVTPTASPTIDDITLALNGSLLGNVDLSAASTAAISGTTTGTNANTGMVSNPIPAVGAVPAVATPVATVAATLATASPVASTAVNNTPPSSIAANSSAEATGAWADNFLLDSVAEARANIDRNPAYAGAAAGLYLSAMIFHLLPASAIVLPNITDSVQPVAAPPIVSAVKLARR
jgi:hypothetical protein